jgi:diacylglycerol kinase (ATP)
MGANRRAVRHSIHGKRAMMKSKQQGASRLVIWNGKSGNAGLFEQVYDHLANHAPMQVVQLQEDVDLPDVIRRAVLQEGCRMVIAAGGDGTVNSVVSAIMQIEQQARPRLVIIPLGTANDFAGTLAIENDVRLIVNSIDKESFVPVDVVRTRGLGFERYFANVAAGGNSVRVTDSMTEELKSTWGAYCYVRGAISVLGELETYKVQIETQDSKIEVESWGVLVANGRTNAGRIAVAPLASPIDGLLDVVIVRDGDVLDMIDFAAKTLLTSLLDSDLVLFQQVERLRVQSNPVMKFTLDGELLDEVPQEFEVVPGAIEMLVGPEFKQMYGLS